MIIYEITPAKNPYRKDSLKLLELLTAYKRGTKETHARNSRLKLGNKKATVMPDRQAEAELNRTRRDIPNIILRLFSLLPIIYRGFEGRVWK